MSKKKKTILILLGAVLLIGLAGTAKTLWDVRNYQAEVAAITISEVDLSRIPDGTYQGAYDADLIKVTVAVEVRDHRITGIELLRHDNGKGAPAEAVIPQVLETQSLDVDLVSGATNSSKLILKSIQLALESAP